MLVTADCRFSTRYHDITTQVWSAYVCDGMETIERNHWNSAGRAAFAADRRHVTGSPGITAKIRGAGNLCGIETLERHRNSATGIAFEADMRSSMGSRGAATKLRSADEAACLATLGGHQNSVGRGAPAADRRLDAGIQGITAKIWRADGTGGMETLDDKSYSWPRRQSGHCSAVPAEPRGSPLFELQQLWSR